jgi:ATP-dependent DNA ligase
MIYYFPNIPHLLSPDSSEIDKYSKDTNWVAELKMNGSNCLLYKENNKYHFYDRHGKMLVYTPISELIQELDNLKIQDNSILNAELLHNKTKVTKNTLFFHCILKWDNKLYNGVTFGKQREHLESIFNGNKYNYLILANHYKGEFKKIFKKVINNDKENLIEGLVLKNLTGKININTNSSKEVWWMIKIRKPSKNYTF